MFFSFGKRKSTRSHRPPAKLLQICRQCGVKSTHKRNGRRCYHSTSVLKKRCLKVLHAHLKKLDKRGSGFGMAPFSQPKAYGYHEKIHRHPGSLPQTNSVVTRKNNINRPPGTGLNSKNIPTYGTYARFFTEKVPKVVGPHSIGFMGQPDGTLYAVGSPFYRYTQPVSRRLRETRRQAVPKKVSMEKKMVASAKNKLEASIKRLTRKAASSPKNAFGFPSMKNASKLAGKASGLAGKASGLAGKTAGLGKLAGKTGGLVKKKAEEGLLRRLLRQLGLN